MVLALSREEAAALAQAIANVQRHYDSRISARTLDWIALVQAAGMIYGSRLVTMYHLRGKKSEPQEVATEPWTPPLQTIPPLAG